MSQMQPPGWYHAQGDPPDTHRYWDGSQWIGDPQPINPGAGPGGHELASPWNRLLARILDTLFLVVPIAFILQGIFDVEVFPTDDATPDLTGLIVLSVASIIYEIALVARFGGTLGKLVLGLRIIDNQGVTPPTLQTAALRWLPAGLGYLPGGFGVLAGLAVAVLSAIWIFNDSQRRTVYDRVADTRVIVHRS